MLPEKLHIEQIERFHKTHSVLKERIDKETDKDKRVVLLSKYFGFHELWNKIDDFIEYTIKQELDELTHEINC